MDTEGSNTAFWSLVHLAGYSCPFPPAGMLLTMTRAEQEQESVQLVLLTGQ